MSYKIGKYEIHIHSCNHQHGYNSNVSDCCICGEYFCYDYIKISGGGHFYLCKGCLLKYNMEDPSDKKKEQGIALLRMKGYF